MNILYHFRTRGTGPESVHIAGVARAFEQLGHKVSFCSPTDVNPLQSAGANPYGNRARTGFIRRLVDACPGFLFEFLEIAYNLSAWRRISSLLKRNDFQLIYERHAFFLCAAAILAHRRRIPIVIEVNELVGDDRVRRQPLLAFLARRCDRIAFARAAAIITVSPHLKRRIVAMGVDESKILVLPNAIDETQYSNLPEPHSLRRSLQIDPNSVVIGFVGWFVVWHRLDRLVEVFAELARTRPGLRLMLVGDGDLKAELQARAAALEVASQVVFTGAVSHADIPAHIDCMDVCVVPHSNEFRSPIKLFEYMGQGKTVVVPKTEPIQMVIDDRQNGILFDPDSADGLRRSLETAIDDSGLRERIGCKAREDALERHTWKRNAEKTLAAVDKPELEAARR